ncbi:DNA cross-link repair protein pso2/snm1 [Penicillium macrosclerotiorum]|uniref:DNA cross-link repair protein pso2/snm1 n=1 Tax=Penicillium macrosclerotiorum TaxID=303699 RepID=UPI002547CF6C|nr:DNA cross-link repair protein pso2/snm1 [Penicillium macrosclerotiorum]KAJ5698828.1 DNA cross-link repair protein pso2/snm1 [Penicillium macrosclerotiorum]
MAGPYARKTSTPSKGLSSSAKSSSTKRNGSILNFFQKTDTPPGATSRQPRITQFVGSSGSPSSGRGTPKQQHGNSSMNDAAGGLFLEDKKRQVKSGDMAAATNDISPRTRSPTPENLWGDDDDDIPDPGRSQYNENGLSVKRRKMDSPSPSEEKPQTGDAAEPAPSPPATTTKTTSGPFIDESDSEDDIDAYRELKESSLAPADTRNEPPSPVDDDPSADPAQSPLVRDATSHAEDNEFTNFDDIEEDEFVGEEFRERPWNDDEDVQNNDNSMGTLDELDDFASLNPENECEVAACPICQRTLVGLSETEISVHVNDCLDGKTDIITPDPSTTTTTPNTTFNPSTSKKDAPAKALTLAERAAIARPAQANPYAQNTSGERSAFSKMMAGNAEDTAWKTAAANEVSSRGKQAYQRTCPFYKILPGFSICVDAFRYGAVEGCNAYFLSHFHSDHYIGLSKSWCHGPIYCSRATANLVRQQLRVDPQWIVGLDFETTSEVPDTGGVQVTMIPANHCPGSSLFLFEKSFGSGPHARRQRILHCGDFRASPDHVRHPLLRPNPNDPTTGQPRQQRIDSCYLDTTYLNPKYAFPSQDDVIAACSDLCVRLNQEAGVGNELGKTGVSSLMSKFLSVTKSDSAQRPSSSSSSAGGRLLVVIGTYSIGKERICLGIARALGSKIFATPQKQRICACLEDPELSAMLTSDPREAQVHMQTLFEIRADTLTDYLDSMKPHFSRVVGFRPTGWSYRPPAGRMLENPPVPTVLRGEHWRTPFTSEHLTPQRGSTRESACFGVPYSEHSSFRELTMFCCALRIGKVIPTVNVGNQRTREQMKAWIDRWEGEKKRNGLFRVEDW